MQKLVFKSKHPIVLAYIQVMSTCVNNNHNTTNTNMSCLNVLIAIIMVILMIMIMIITTIIIISIIAMKITSLYFKAFKSDLSEHSCLILI